MLLRIAATHCNAGNIATVFAEVGKSHRGVVSGNALAENLCGCGIGEDEAQAAAAALDSDGMGCSFLEFSAACLPALGRAYDDMVRGELTFRSSGQRAHLAAQEASKLWEELAAVLQDGCTQAPDPDLSTGVDGAVPLEALCAFFNHQAVGYTGASTPLRRASTGEGSELSGPRFCGQAARPPTIRTAAEGSGSRLESSSGCSRPGTPLSCAGSRAGSLGTLSTVATYIKPAVRRKDTKGSSGALDEALGLKAAPAWDFDEATRHTPEGRVWPWRPSASAGRLVVPLGEDFVVQAPPRRWVLRLGEDCEGWAGEANAGETGPATVGHLSPRNRVEALALRMQL